MTGNSEPTAGNDGGVDGEIVTASIDPNPETAEYDLLAIVADLEDTEITDLPSLYEQLDHFVEQLYETPPSPKAQLELSFSYAGYRITLTQGGDVTLMNVKQSIP